MKKILLTLFFFSLIQVHSFALSVVVDGQPLQSDVPPQIMHGRTMIPARALANALQAVVDWDEKNQTFTIRKHSHKLVLTIGKNEAIVNGKRQRLDVSPVIVENRAMLPLSFIAKNMGLDVQWIEKSKIVLLKTPDTPIKDSESSQKTYSLPKQLQTKREAILTTLPQAEKTYITWIDKNYAIVDFFSNHLAPVKIGENYGFINSMGQELIPSQYEGAGRFGQGLAPVKKEGKWGFINSSNQFVIQPQYEDAKTFSQNLAPVKISGKWGFVDTKGVIRIPATYEDAFSFSEGLASVKKGEKFGFINTKGQLIIPMDYKLTQKFSQGLAPVLDSTYRWRIIDSANKTIFRLEDSSSYFLGDFSNDMIPVKKNHLAFYMNKQGKKHLVPTLAPIPETFSVYSFSEGLAIVDPLNYPKRVIDTKGNLIFTLPKNVTLFQNDSYRNGPLQDAWKFNDGTLIVYRENQGFGIVKNPLK